MPDADLVKRLRDNGGGDKTRPARRGVFELYATAVLAKLGTR
jgi:hypothetical protein